MFILIYYVSLGLSIDKGLPHNAGTIIPFPARPIDSILVLGWLKCPLASGWLASTHRECLINIMRMHTNIAILILHKQLLRHWLLPHPLSLHPLSPHTHFGPILLDKMSRIPPTATPPPFALCFEHPRSYIPLPYPLHPTR